MRSNSETNSEPPGGQRSEQLDRTTDFPAGDTPPNTIDHAPAPSDALSQTQVPVSTELEETRGYAMPAAKTKKPLPKAIPIPGYEILGELGRGGMGVVYKAVDVELKRVVAIKMILAAGEASDAALARFRAEARAVARFQHPNIVTIHEVGEAEGNPYFTLEFVDGLPLSKKIGKEPQEPRYCAELVEQIARAMDYAHQQGVIHRDLKPANVMLTKEGVAKVADFGLAKQVEGESVKTHAGTVLGTPSFMAPEQATGNPDLIGPLADVYSMGAILYDMLTGRPPFVGTSVLDTLEMVKTRDPVAPSQFIANIPKDLETITLKCLEKSPTKRYESAGALAADLRRYLDNLPIHARPISGTERAWRWAKRNPWIAGLSTAVTAALLIIAIGGWLLSVQLAHQKKLAEDNAKDANTQKTVAQVNEKEAKKQTLIAQANERTAQEAQAAEAKARDLQGKFLTASQDTTRGVLQNIDNLMRNDAKLAPTRKAILELALKDLQKVAELVEKPGPLEGRNESVALQRLGDTFLKANDVQKASEMFERSHGIAETLVKKFPDDPILTRNLAAITSLRGDMQARLGDGGKAHGLYQKALELRNQWSRMDPSDSGRHHAIAQSHLDLCQNDLRQGDPTRAREHWDFARKLLDELPKDYPTEPRDKAMLARDRARLRSFQGQTSVRLGNFDAAESELRSNVKILQARLAKSPNDRAAHSVLAATRLDLGDLLLAVRKDPKSALKEYESSLESLRPLIKSNPDHLDLQRAISAAHYRVGVAVGDKAASEHFAECVRIRKQLADIDPRDTQAKLEYMLALGRFGQSQEAEKHVQDLLKQAPNDPRILFQSTCGMSVAACGTKDAKERERCQARALDSLDRLIKSGWKDRVTLETDPDLDAIRSSPRFGELIAGLPTLTGNQTK